MVLPVLLTASVVPFSVDAGLSYPPYFLRVLGVCFSILNATPVALSARS